MKTHFDLTATEHEKRVASYMDTPISVLEERLAYLHDSDNWTEEDKIYNAPSEKAIKEAIEFKNNFKNN